MATPYADYKVAAVNENWQPLAGVEIEAMNLATLLADAIATTGLDGVASFSGLPAGPHFFRVRATRVSTKVGHRTFIGQIHLQVIAMGHQGIVKDAIVDKNGHGTHTTIQAAINSVLASGGSGYYVIHINPGLYQELLTVAFGVSGGSLILEAQGEVKNLPGRTYNKVVRISQPAGQGTQNTLTLTGTGGLELRGLDIGSDISGHAVKVTGTAASLLVRDCDLHSVGGQAIQATINIAVLDSIIASDSSVAFGSAAGAATWLFSRCAIIGAPAISGDFNELAFDDCWLNFAGASSNYTIQESNLVVSQKLRMTGCNIAAGTLGGIYFGNASGNVSQDLIFVGNYIYGSGKAGTQKGITLVCVKGAVIVGNKFRSLGYGIYLMPVGGVTVQGLIVDGNSFDSVGVAIHADAGAMDTTDIIGPNAFQDVTTPYEGVPGSSLYTSHTLLDGVYHTDTLLGVVLDGDTIVGNATPKWSRLAISIPTANVRNVLGIDNGELRPSWKTALDGTAAADIAAAGAAGTSLVFSHRDHVHKHPVFGSGALHTDYELVGVAAGLITTHAALTTGVHGVGGSTVASIADIATHAALADVHHAGFIGLTIAGPANIDPDAGDRITFVDSATVTWDSPAANQIRATGAGGGGAHNILSATHSDAAVQAVSRGSLIVGNATPAWDELTIGPNGSLLTSDGTDAAWDTSPYIAGHVGIGAAVDVFGSSMLTIAPDAATARGILIWAAVAQSVDFLRVLSSGGTLLATLRPDGASCHLEVEQGDVTSGVSDSRIGIFTAYGDAALGDHGGILQLHAAADYQAVGFDCWAIQPIENDLHFSLDVDPTVGGGVVKVSFTYAGQVQIPTAGVGAGIRIGGDTYLYRSGATQLLLHDGAGGGILWIGDSNHGFNFAGGSPQWVFDSGDLWKYTRASNLLEFYIGGTVQFSFVASLATFPRGGLAVGTDDSLRGTLTLYGHGAGTEDGAEIDLYLSADHDTTFQYWGIDAFQDDLRFFSSDGVTVNQMTAEGLLVLPRTGSTAGLLIGGDTALYRGAADVFYSPDSLHLAGYARVGSLSAPLNTTAGDLTCARLFVGDAAAVAGVEALITGDAAVSTSLVVGASAAATAGLTLDVRGELGLLNQAALRLYDTGSSNYVGHRSNAARTTDIIYEWPATDPTAGQFLQSSAPAAGVATLSWAGVLYSVHDHLFAPDAAPATTVTAGDAQGMYHHSGPDGDTAFRFYLDAKTAPGTDGLPVTIQYGDTDDLDTVASWTTIAAITSITSGQKTTIQNTMSNAAIPANRLIRCNWGTIVGTPKDAQALLRVLRPLRTAVP